MWNLKPLKNLHNLDSDLAEFCFERTPRMSTYLVAYVIGEYDYIEQIDAVGRAVRIYTPIHKSEMGRFSLEVV